MDLQEELKTIHIEVNDTLSVLDESRNWPVCGGNKVRKLYRILGEERVKGLLTFGSKYSSHCLAAAYWGARHDCPVRLLVLDEEEIDIPRYPHLVLSKKLGAELIFVPIEQAHEKISDEQVRFSEYRWIPGGGHCLAGLEAYKDWFLSVLSEYPELRKRTKVILPYGTGTTALGILAAIREEELSMQVIGVSVSRDRIRCLTAAREFIDEASITYLQIDDRYSGRYGERENHHDNLRMEFLKRIGVLPDPIYNVRVVEYLYEENVTEGIVIHTGGQLNNLLP